MDVGQHIKHMEAKFELVNGKPTNRSILEVEVDVETDPSKSGCDPHLLDRIKAAAIQEWVEKRQQPPEDEVRLYTVRANA